MSSESSRTEVLVAVRHIGRPDHNVASLRIDGVADGEPRAALLDLEDLVVRVHVQRRALDHHLGDVADEREPRADGLALDEAPQRLAGVLPIGGEQFAGRGVGGLGHSGWRRRACGLWRKPYYPIARRKASAKAS